MMGVFYEVHQAVAASCHHDTPGSTSNRGQPRQQALNNRLTEGDEYVIDTSRRPRATVALTGEGPVRWLA